MSGSYVHRPNLKRTTCLVQVGRRRKLCRWNNEFCPKAFVVKALDKCSPTMFLDDQSLSSKLPQRLANDALADIQHDRQVSLRGETVSFLHGLRNDEPFQDDYDLLGERPSGYLSQRLAGDSIDK